jgi:hypothetical protein
LQGQLLSRGKHPRGLVELPRDLHIVGTSSVEAHPARDDATVLVRTHLKPEGVGDVLVPGDVVKGKVDGGAGGGTVAAPPGSQEIAPSGSTALMAMIASVMNSIGGWNPRIPVSRSTAASAGKALAASAVM